MINEKQAKKYCKEDISMIKNYDLAIADTTQVWHCHHMTETWWNCTSKELIENECYYNRKACELIFLTPAEHKRLHKQGHPSAFKGRKHSEESRIKMSESLKGHTVSEETRKKMSEANKGRTFTEDAKKKMSESKKGRPSNRKGVTLSEETRKKLSEAQKRRWALKKESIIERK